MSEEFEQLEMDRETVCGACGRHVGPAARCGFCDAACEVRRDVRWLRRAAVCLATVGLALLYAMVLTREIPVVEIGRVAAAMNFATVRLAGRVSGDPRMDWRAGRLCGMRFRLDDGTGMLPVWVDADAARFLEGSDRLPRDGDWMEVTGRLSLSAEYGALRLRSPERVRLEREPETVAPLSSVTSAADGEVVTVRAIILEIVPPAAEGRPWVLKLGEGSARCDLVIWHEQWRHLADREPWQAGMQVQARGRVSRYRNRPQLTLLCVSGLGHAPHRTGAMGGAVGRTEGL